ncbi:MAG: translation initiation factor IF-2 [Polyangiaceae bacterium]|nr:translation initiation factor IF-2 [Polyangiaceae bacterium]
MDNKALVALLQSVGVSEARNHMSAVGPEAVERVKRHLEKQPTPKVVEERIRPTVVKRRAVSKTAPERSASAQPSHEVVARRPPPSVQPRARAVRPAHIESPPAPAVEPEAPRHEPLPVVAEAPAAEVPAAEPPAVAVEPVVEHEAARVVEPLAPPEEAASAPEPVAQSAHRAEQALSEAVVEPEVAQAPPEPAAMELEPAVVAAPAVEPEPAPAPEVSSPLPPPPALPQVEVPPAAPPSVAPRPRTGIDVWEGRPGVPMPQAPRGPTPRRVQYDAKAGVQAGRRGPVRPGARGGAGARARGIGALARPKGSGQPVTQQRSAHKKVVKIDASIGLQTLANRMGIKAHELLRKLVMLGMTGVNINSTLDADTAKLVSAEFGWEVEDVAVTEEQALLTAQGLQEGDAEEKQGEPRPAVVTVMGHVDHGKTSLLDQIRKTNVAAGETGGITQHIGAYSVDTAYGRVTFLDTPGHEAFTAMRARGAQVTDIVVLVVAADDGVMPQTREAVNHARAANVPIVVAVNKIDKPEAQPERVRRELSELGLVPEEWGGETLFTEVSAVTRQGVDVLLEQIALQAELLDLRANPDKPAAGVVIEAELDRGKGPVATVLVTEGTLNRGDVLLAGGAFGKARAMLDSMGRQVKAAGPSTPISLIGLSDVPSAGDPVHAVTDIKKAQEIAESRKAKERKTLITSSGPRISLEDLARSMAAAEQLELKVIIKADVQGSVEAVSDALTRLSTDKVKVTVVNAAAGGITEGDVNLALASGAIIIGFNVRPAGKATQLAQQEGVEIRQYGIIYNVVDDVKNAMEGMLAPTLVENVIGKAEVRQVFKLSKAGTVAGCMVTEGVVRRSATARLLRDSRVVWTGKFSSLKRFKDDVREVKEGFDCGIALENYNDVKEGDFIEVVDVEEVKQTL